MCVCVCVCACSVQCVRAYVVCSVGVWVGVLACVPASVHVYVHDICRTYDCTVHMKNTARCKTNDHVCVCVCIYSGTSVLTLCGQLAGFQIAEVVKLRVTHCVL